jgi:hypothetical protein
VSESEKNLLKAVQDSHLPFQTSVFVSRNAGRAAVL